MQGFDADSGVRCGFSTGTAARGSRNEPAGICAGVAGLAFPVGDPSAGQVVWRDLDDHPIAGHNSDEVLPHLAGDVSQHLMPVIQFDPKSRVCQRFRHSALCFNGLFFGHNRSPSSFQRNSKSLIRLQSTTTTDPLNRSMISLSHRGRKEQSGNLHGIEAVNCDGFPLELPVPELVIQGGSEFQTGSATGSKLSNRPDGCHIRQSITGISGLKILTSEKVCWSQGWYRGFRWAGLGCRPTESVFVMENPNFFVDISRAELNNLRSRFVSVQPVFRPPVLFTDTVISLECLWESRVSCARFSRRTHRRFETDSQ